MEDLMVLNAIEVGRNLIHEYDLDVSILTEACEAANIIKAKNYPCYIQAMAILFNFRDFAKDSDYEEVFGDLSLKPYIKEDIDALRMFYSNREADEKIVCDVVRNLTCSLVVGSYTVKELRDKKVTFINTKEVLNIITFISTTIYPALNARHSIFCDDIMDLLKNKFNEVMNVTTKLHFI